MEGGDQEFPISFDQHADFEALIEVLNETEKMLHFGVWGVHIASGRLQCSNGMCGMLGYDRAELPDQLRLDFFLDHIDENDRPGFVKAMDEALQNKTSFEHTYTLNKRGKGDVIAYSKAKIINDKAGRPVRMAGVTRDITAERDYEQSLEDKVKELDRSNKELEEFAYIASHDLQEPLRKITSFSERLKEKLGNDIGADNLFYLNRMLAATDNMRSLIDNLLEFSRTSRYTQAFEEVDLNEMLNEVKADLELKIEETNTSIQTDNLPKLNAIPVQIRQLLNNLINNAIKFKKPGVSPVITISSHSLNKEEKEKYRLRMSKVWRLIEIKDNGIGFEQEFAFKIFQIFQRLHGKSEYPGSGIGLAICKKIVENHKGIIFAESEPEKGAMFTIILPESQT